MKIKSFAIASVLLTSLLAAKSGLAQQEHRPTSTSSASFREAEHCSSEFPKEAVVSSKSPAVTLKEVGRLVHSGLYVVDPRAIRGKRLVLPPSGPQEVGVCYGEWNDVKQTCTGTYVNQTPSKR